MDALNSIDTLGNIPQAHLQGAPGVPAQIYLQAPQAPFQALTNGSPTSTSPAPQQAPLQAPASVPKRRLTRDQRRDILLLRNAAKMTYLDIAMKLQVPYGAVQYTCQTQTSTPKKPPGRRSKLCEEDVRRVEAFMNESESNRQMSYRKIIEALGLNVNTECLSRALLKRGYSRRK